MLGKNLTKDVFYAGKKPTYFLQKKKERKYQTEKIPTSATIKYKLKSNSFF